MYYDFTNIIYWGEDFFSPSPSLYVTLSMLRNERPLPLPSNQFPFHLLRAADSGPFQSISEFDMEIRVKVVLSNFR